MVMKILLGKGIQILQLGGITRISLLWNQKNYLQDNAWGSQDILDVESVVFNWPEEAAQWIEQCLNHDPFMTLRRLRVFLSDECLEHFHVYKMNDTQVVREAARQLSRHAYQVVIEPRMGWAVQVDIETSEPVQPIAVEPAPDIEGMLDELRIQLNALVAEQKKNFSEWEAKLASMSEAEKAALYGKKAGSGLYNATLGSVVGLVKSLPGLAKKAAKVWWKFKSYPLRLAKSTAQALEEGSWGPLKREVEAVVDPVVRSAKKVKQVTTMVAVLFEERVTRNMLLDFVDRYWDNTHPLEKTEMGAEAASEVVMTILLAIFTAGVGVAANIAVKSGRLVKVAKLLERLASTLKRVSSLHKLPKKRGSGGFLSGPGNRKSKSKKEGVPPPEPPNKKAEVGPKTKTKKKTTRDTSNVLVQNQPKSLKRVTSSGARLVANPEKTTTVLGRYGDDMKDVMDELDYPKTLDFGEKKGGFNVLNAPDHLYENADQFWNDYNKPFLDKAIDRGDDIVMATKPEAAKLRNLDTGELTGFGREFEYLTSKDYEYDSGTNMMIRR